MSQDDTPPMHTDVVTAPVTASPAEEAPEDRPLTDEEVFAGSRRVVLPSGRTARLLHPTPEVAERGRELYSVRFSEILFSDDPFLKRLPLRCEMAEVLARRGVWTSQMEERVKDLERLLRRATKEQVKLQAEIAAADTHDKSVRKKAERVRALTEESREFQAESTRLSSLQDELFANTVEGFASSEQRLFLYWSCIKQADGETPFWSSVGELRGVRLDDVDVRRALAELLFFWAGLGRDREGFFDD